MLWITGDLHGEFARLQYEEREHHWTEQDCLLICGDFGLVTRDDPEKLPRMRSARSSSFRPMLMDIFDAPHRRTASPGKKERNHPRAIPFSLIVRFIGVGRPYTVL